MSSRTRGNLGRLSRGALSGALGGPLFLFGLALSDKLRLGYVPYGGMIEIAAVPFSLLIGAAYGTAVAGVIWALAARAIYPPVVVRALIGLSLPLLVLITLHLLQSGRNTGLNPPTPIEALTNVLLYAVCFGTLPGIAAYAKTK